MTTAAQIGFKQHGVAFPFVVVHRSLVYFGRKNFGAKIFSLAGREHTYEIHPFILDNERTVEIGLARSFLSGRTGEILEVGNVLANFMARPHDVVDKYEVAPGVINEDIITYAPGKKYAAIVTLSTLEHVGWDETPRTPEKILTAIAHLKSLLAEGGQLLATMPVGYNSFLDELFKKDARVSVRLNFLSAPRRITSGVRLRSKRRWPKNSASPTVAQTHSSSVFLRLAGNDRALSAAELRAVCTSENNCELPPPTTVENSPRKNLGQIISFCISPLGLGLLSAN